ncbi:MAG: ATP-binding protein [Candidatus Symbiothrix sp.]|jgi:energy-coupling factor transporter ATP-binding protein EcfA2|nr:ATP-binding protein [Candidatus Symbiothrix sp.]
MNQLKVKSFGPIEEADIRFGDLTLLVGAQASGKSIFLQLLKLLIDKQHIQKSVEQFGYIWKKEDDILNLYFGEDMAAIWSPDSVVSLDNVPYSRNFLSSKRISAKEKLFYIPAQRILSIADGRPKTFMEFDLTAPYVLRYFSETLRLLLQNGMKTSIFPIQNLLNETLRTSFNDSIFHDGKIMMTGTGQKKFRMEIGNMNVPFITWSAGQKEFMPLLLAFYWLCPPSKAKTKDSYQYVVIEEPEMGLHPQAIKSVILQVIDLLSRGYKVIISTHSPVLLEFAWAFNLLKKSKVPDKALFELFNMKVNAQNKQLLDNILANKNINTYYFARKSNKVITKDISSLDADSEDIDIAEWGGISQFAGRATDIVSKYFVDDKE